MNQRSAVGRFGRIQTSVWWWAFGTSSNTCCFLSRLQAIVVVPFPDKMRVAWRSVLIRTYKAVVIRMLRTCNVSWSTIWLLADYGAVCGAAPCREPRGYFRSASDRGTSSYERLLVQVAFSVTFRGVRHNKSLAYGPKSYGHA